MALPSSRAQPNRLSCANPCTVELCFRSPCPAQLKSGVVLLRAERRPFKLAARTSGFAPLVLPMIRSAALFVAVCLVPVVLPCASPGPGCCETLVDGNGHAEIPSDWTSIDNVLSRTPPPVCTHLRTA